MMKKKVAKKKETKSLSEEVDVDEQGINKLKFSCVMIILNVLFVH